MFLDKLVSCQNAHNRFLGLQRCFAYRLHSPSQYKAKLAFQEKGQSFPLRTAMLYMTMPDLIPPSKHKKLETLLWTVVAHLHYNLNLSPCDYYMFDPPKRRIWRTLIKQKYSCGDIRTQVAEDRPSLFFFDNRMKKLLIS